MKKLSEARALLLMRRAIDALRDEKNIYAALKAASTRGLERKFDRSDYIGLVDLVGEIGKAMARRELRGGEKLSWDLEWYDGQANYAMRFYLLSAVLRELERRTDPSITSEEREALGEVMTRAAKGDVSNREMMRKERELERQLKVLVTDIRNSACLPAAYWIANRIEALLKEHGGTDGRDQAEEE